MRKIHLSWGICPQAPDDRESSSNRRAITSGAAETDALHARPFQPAVDSDGQFGEIGDDRSALPIDHPIRREPRFFG
jgi:hypothetical protein